MLAKVAEAKVAEDHALTSIYLFSKSNKNEKIGKLLSEKTANTGDMTHAFQHFSTEPYGACAKKLHRSILNTLVIAG